MMWLLGISVLVVIALCVLVMSAGDRPGARPSGERLDRVRASAQWYKGRFRNTLKRVDGNFIEMGRQYFFGGQKFRTPTVDTRAMVVEPKHLKTTPPKDGRVTWFGHSSLLVELDSKRILIDPVWSERASPFTWAGPKRFYEPPIALEQIPDIDAVIISHDHYDHLDMKAVQALAPRDVRWICPLGVGAHLEKWGIDTELIVELDWWGDYSVGELTITATPSRHFSGRSVLFTDQNKTLWAGWSIAGRHRRVFYSGDTALHPEFEAIGQRLGPFDLTIMEVGAYDALWADVHLGPEQALIAHTLVRGRVLMPVHWGTFDLALHGWVEPIERLLAAAALNDVTVAVPRPGGSVDIGALNPTVDPWWPTRPWRDVETAPAWSSKVSNLQKSLKQTLESE